MATNNATNTSNPVSIAQGGTNASSMSTSTGLVNYDGTRLITSTTALIDSTGRQTNSAQPCFVSDIDNPTNVTGDGTAYTVAYSNAFVNRGSYYNAGTFIFTAPVTGIYQFSVLLSYTLSTSTPTSGTVGLVTTGNTFTLQTFSSLVQAQAISTVNSSIAVPMTATDTAKVVFTMTGSTKAVSILGASGALRSTFSGFLIC